MDTEKLKSYDCPLNLAISVLSGKYKIEIMFCLYVKTMRFNELQRHIPKASSKVLSQQLKELEADGMIIRKVYPEIPPRTEYSLTETGRKTQPIVAAMYRWGEEIFSDNNLEIPCRDEEVKVLLGE